ncbi:anti-sigma factor family protein [Acidobacteriota bacterium]
MKNCQKIRKDLVAFLYGELNSNDRMRVKAHLDVCSSCRDEAAELEFVQKESGSFIPELSEVMSSVNWETLPGKIADKVLRHDPEVNSSRLKKTWFSLLVQPKWRPVYAGLLFGIIMGSFTTYFVLRSPRLQVVKTPEIIFTSDFLEKAELEVARRETLEYLEKSQYLLLDFVQSPSGVSSEIGRDETALQKARDLLSKKKFIDSQLDKFHMAKAKRICDQIEYLFYELTQISEDLHPEALKRVQNLIQEHQLMLKIKLVKKELKNREI